MMCYNLCRQRLCNNEVARSSLKSVIAHVVPSPEPSTTIFVNNSTFPCIFAYLSEIVSGAEIKGIWRSRIKESASTCFEHAHVAKQPAPLHWQQLKSTTHHCDLRKEQNVKSKFELLSRFALSQCVHQHVDVELVTSN